VVFCFENSIKYYLKFEQLIDLKTTTCQNSIKERFFNYLFDKLLIALKYKPFICKRYIYFFYYFFYGKGRCE
jgi:hypothetical protein